MIGGEGSNNAVRESRGFDFSENFGTAFTNVMHNVGGLVVQQEVADDGKRGLQDGGTVAGGVKLLRDDGG